MKTLYESILDDEDILVDKVKQQANNPFLRLKTFKGQDLMKYKDKIISVLKELPLPKSSNLKNVNYIYDVDDQKKKIYIRNGDQSSFNNVCTITMDPAHSVFDDDRDIIIIQFDETYFHQNALRYYLKKYNLTPYYKYARNGYSHMYF